MINVFLIFYGTVLQHSLYFESKYLFIKIQNIYKIIFRHANVFANLFSLMLDANIPDIALERDKTVKKVIKNEKQ